MIFWLEFILHEMFVTGTVDKTHVLVMYENDIELLTKALLWITV